MPFESVLFAKSVAVALPAGWLALGVYNNVRFPVSNMGAVTGVLTLEGMREAFPDIEDAVMRRAINSPTLVAFLYWGIVLAEIVVTAGLLFSAACLLCASLGHIGGEQKLWLANLSVTGFTAIWGAFLVGGQWFSYWFNFAESQKTHFHMLQWGLLTLIFLNVG